jgi:hypothetical protein
MNQTIQERNKGLVLEAFDTLTSGIMRLSISVKS